MRDVEGGWWSKNEACFHTSCDGHWIVGTSVNLAWWAAGATKGVIVAAIVAAILATGPGGAIASALEGAGATLKAGVIAAVEGIGTAALRGNSLTVATVDWDLNTPVHNQKMWYFGGAMGSFVPDGSELMSLMNSFPGHVGATCD